MIVRGREMNGRLPCGNVLFVENFFRAFRLVEGGFQGGDFLFRGVEFLLNVVVLASEVVFILPEYDDFLPGFG